MDIGVDARRRARQAVAVAVIVFAATGCSAKVSTGDDATSTRTKISVSTGPTIVTVSQATLEERSAAQLALDPAHPPEIKCAGDLRGVVGTTQKCDVLIQGQWHPYTVSVTEVVNAQVNWRIKADDPDSIPR